MTSFLDPPCHPCSRHVRNQIFLNNDDSILFIHPKLERFFQKYFQKFDMMRTITAIAALSALVTNCGAFAPPNGKPQRC